MKRLAIKSPTDDELRRWYRFARTYGREERPTQPEYHEFLRWSMKHVEWFESRENYDHMNRVVEDIREELRRERERP